MAILFIRLRSFLYLPGQLPVWVHPHFDEIEAVDLLHKLN
jgi:hypothetical protein